MERECEISAIDSLPSFEICKTEDFHDHRTEEKMMRWEIMKIDSDWIIIIIITGRLWHVDSRWMFVWMYVLKSKREERERERERGRRKKWERERERKRAERRTTTLSVSWMTSHMLTFVSRLQTCCTASLAMERMNN